MRNNVSPLAARGRNGRIAFIRIWPRVALFTIRPDGTGVKRLRSIAADAATPPFPPLWLPNGRTIAFGARHTIYLVDADGTNPRRPFGDALIGSPAWSPDGRSVAYIKGRRSGEDTLYGEMGIHVMRADGSASRLVTSLAWASTPAWAPGGRRIAFCAGRRIYVVDVGGTGLRMLTSAANSVDRNPDWSPDGSRIVFSRQVGDQADIYVSNANGARTRRLTRSRRGRWCEQPSWSPDGKKIVFVSNRRVANFSGIYVMNADGTNQREILGGRSFDYGPAWQRLAR